MTTRPQGSGLPSAAQDVAHRGLVRPPLVFLTSLVTGALSQLARPFPFLPGTLAVPLGASLVVLAIALFCSSIATFRAAGTPVPARKPTTVIVRTGPYRATPAQVALAWLLAQKPWIVPIPGTTKRHRLEENLGAVAIHLTPEDLAEIDRSAAAISVHGARYPEALQKLVGR